MIPAPGLAGSGDEVIRMQSVGLLYNQLPTERTYHSCSPEILLGRVRARGVRGLPLYPEADTRHL